MTKDQEKEMKRLHKIFAEGIHRSLHSHLPQKEQDRLAKQLPSLGIVPFEAGFKTAVEHMGKENDAEYEVQYLEKENQELKENLEITVLNANYFVDKSEELEAQLQECRDVVEFYANPPLGIFGLADPFKKAKKLKQKMGWE